MNEWRLSSTITTYPFRRLPSELSDFWRSCAGRNGAHSHRSLTIPQFLFHGGIGEKMCVATKITDASSLPTLQPAKAWTARWAIYSKRKWSVAKNVAKRLGKHVACLTTPTKPISAERSRCTKKQPSFDILHRFLVTKSVKNLFETDRKVWTEVAPTKRGINRETRCPLPVLFSTNKMRFMQRLKRRMAQCLS